MEIVLWVLVAILSVAFGYTLKFGAATLYMGRALNEGRSKTGFQDAISPPWETRLALTVFLVIPVVVGILWWSLSWISGLVALAIIFVGSSLVRIFLPKPSGNHYRHLILQSMASRYASYVRDGDIVKAEAMKYLFDKASALEE